MSEKPFSVIAGKYDGYERNCKYSGDFKTLDEALEAYEGVASYPWAFIQYKEATLEVFGKDFDPFD